LNITNTEVFNVIWLKKTNEYFVCARERFTPYFNEEAIPERV
jgi:hypothetical protein